MNTQITDRAGRREWIGLAALALPTLLLSLDLSVLYLALPQLSADLGADSTEQLWIMDIYGFMIAGFLITMGSLGDRIGRRRLLLIGAAAFSVASVLAAYSTSVGMLIATRAVLGIAGATLMPSTLALISNMFRDAKQRGMAIALWMSCFMGGIAVGPVVGGVLLEHFWWGSGFLLGVPVMVALLIAGPILLPEYRAPQSGRLDLASVALSLAAILPFIYGLKDLAKNGVGTVPAATIAVGLVVGVLFVRRQRTLTSPLLDLRLFANRTFSSALTIWLLFGAIQGGSYLFFALYLQVVAGLSPLESGLWLVPGALAMITASMLSPAAAQRFRPGALIAAGMGLAAVGNLMLTRLDGDGSVILLVVGLAVILFGVGFGAALGTDLILGSAPPEKAGSASALSETSGEFGIAFGVAALGSISTAVYRDQIGDAIPAGVPADSAATAREGVTEAASAASQLPAPLGTELLDGAREAFTTGVQVLAGVSGVLFIGLAVLAFTTLRHVRTRGEAQPEEGVDQRATDPSCSSSPAR